MLVTQAWRPEFDPLTHRKVERERINFTKLSSDLTSPNTDTQTHRPESSAFLRKDCPGSPQGIKDGQTDTGERCGKAVSQREPEMRV